LLSTYFNMNTCGSVYPKGLSCEYITSNKSKRQNRNGTSNRAQPDFFPIYFNLKFVLKEVKKVDFPEHPQWRQCTLLSLIAV
jgi:hypothetical protein